MKLASHFFLALLLCGCNQMKIKVLDESNSPLAGAKVTSQTPSVQSDSSFTDKNGTATVPWVLGRQMLRIDLAGFETAYISISSGVPSTITLKKSSASLTHPSNGTR